MKKKLALALALTLALSLFGCAKQQAPQADNTQQTTTQQAAETPVKNDDPAPEPAAEEWHFTVQTQKEEKEYKADDGTVIAKASYEQPVLQLESASGEIFTGSTPERGVTAEQLAACKTFNDATASTGLWDIDLEEQAREVYAFHKENNQEMPPVGDEVTLAGTHQQGALLSVLVDDYVYLGGAHPDSGLHAWNFDLNTGKFVDLKSLTDRPEDMKQTLVSAITAQIYATEELDGYYENWYELLQEKEDFEVCFAEDGMVVFFQEYEIGPHAIGVPSFVIPYGTISRYLNDYGEQLLDLPVEARVIGDFHEAQELWSWLGSGAPADYSDSKVVDINGTPAEVYRVSAPDVHTLSDLSNKLSAYVDKSVVEAELAQSTLFYEIDGVLYVYIAGRGDDLTIASVDYEAFMAGDGESGKVVATIHRQDFDDASGEWKLTGVNDTYEFPFTLRDGHAVFSTMEYLY